jgi:site-specific recombinase XerD
MNNLLKLTKSDLEKKHALIENAKAFIEASTAPATRKAYASDWKIFSSWCIDHDQAELPATAETVVLFLADQAQTGTAPATLNRRLAAIKYAHEAAGLDTPTNKKIVSTTLKGIKRATDKTKQQKAPATADRLAAMLAHIPADTLTGKRDRAILVLGFVGAFRRSELAALTIDDLQETAEGLRVTIRKSKTDQEGNGQTIAIPNGTRLQPVKAVRDWLDAAGITEGAIFRPITKGGSVRPVAITDKSISETVKKYAQAAGFDAADFAGHSLRAGFLTSAAEHGATVFKMAEVSRHKSLQTLQTYVRSAELFKDHAGSAFL